MSLIKWEGLLKGLLWQGRHLKSILYKADLCKVFYENFTIIGSCIRREPLKGILQKITFEKSAMKKESYNVLYNTFKVSI